MEIEAARLKLVPATLPLTRAEIGDRGKFARLLGAPVPDNWPTPPSDALELAGGAVEAGRLAGLLRTGRRCASTGGRKGAPRLIRPPVVTG